MKDPALKYEHTEAGLYVYLERPGRDILLTREQITDPEDVQAISQYLDAVEPKLYAYRRYRAVLNNVLMLCRELPAAGQIAGIVRSALNQFCDLRTPGTEGTDPKF